MSCRVCKDIKFNEDVKAVYFDGTASSISDLQNLLVGLNHLNMHTLHTKIGQWCVRYKNGSVVWKKNKCFKSNYKII